MQLPRLAPGSRKAKGRISGRENVRHGEVVVTQVSLNHLYPGGNPGEEMSLFFSLASYFLLAACWQSRTKHETVCLYLENLPGPGPASPGRDFSGSWPSITCPSQATGQN